MKKILMLMPNGSEMLEAAAFIDVFGWARIAAGLDVSLIIAGENEYIPAAFGHSVRSDMVIDKIDITDYDGVALPGGFPRFGYFASAEKDSFTDILRQATLFGKPIAAVCTGSLVLARAGLLREKQAVIYPGEDGRWTTQLAQAGAIPGKGQLCVDGNIITADGPSAAVFAAFSLLAKITDRASALAVAEMMGYCPEDII